MESAMRRGDRESAGFTQASTAIAQAEFGNAASARQQATAALALAPGTDVQTWAALALACAGDAAPVDKLTESINERHPLDTIVQSYWLPTIRAVVELNRNNPTRSLEFLRMVAPYEFSRQGALFPIYVRGQAYLMAHQSREAVAEFKKLVDHPGVVLNDPTGALARVGMARAYAMQGDTQKARAAYEDFFALWRDADPDIPILKKAKVEYAKVH
jgi:predicted Zn-dependent protease